MGISDYLRNLRVKIGHDMVMMPGVTGIVFNDHEEVLLHRTADYGRWFLPGGALDPGELPADAIVREVWEETGIEVIPEHLSGVYSEPLITYPNGDQVMYISLAFRCVPIGGTLQAHDDESLEIRYFPIDALPELSPNDRDRINHARNTDSQTYFRISEAR
jgi:8-oxo-dGTP diphosphatase